MVKPKRPPGITEELIDASTARNLGKIASNKVLMMKVEKVIDQDLPKAMQLIAPATEKYEAISALADEVSRVFGPVSACRKGCSHCCHQAVGITSVEAEAIGRFIGKNPAPVVTVTTMKAMDPMQYARTPCGFLVDGSCSIYPVRPMACRTYFNPSDYPEICNIYDYEGATIPAINLSPFWAAMSSLVVTRKGLVGSWGDLREYFPDEFAASKARHGQ
jgi:Fe-S-cluster containining protein